MTGGSLACLTAEEAEVKHNSRYLPTETHVPATLWSMEGTWEKGCPRYILDITFGLLQANKEGRATLRKRIEMDGRS